MMVVVKETMTCKEVTIELPVRSEQNGFFGAYFCLEPLLPAPENAIEEARVRAEQHCKNEH